MPSQSSPAEFQLTGADFLAARQYALLGDYMGLRKTSQAIRAVNMVVAENVLVLCPAAVTTVWRDQFKLWSHIKHQPRIIKTTKDELKPGVVVASYDMARREPLRSRLNERAWDVLIVDESHYLKERTSARTQLVYGQACNGRGGLMESAKRVWCLSGTPMPNDPRELWPLLHAFGVYKRDFWTYVKSYCRGWHTPYGFKCIGAKNTERLAELVSNVMIRRRPEEVDIELPPIKHEMKKVEPEEVPLEHFVDLGWWNNQEKALKDLQEQAYMVARVMRSNHGEDRIKAIQSLANTVSGMRRYLGLCKVNAVARLAERLMALHKDDKIVVFAIHRQVLRTLQVIFEGRSLTYWGGLEPTRRQRVIDLFLATWRYRVLFAQMQAAGTGLDGLQQVANRVILAEMSWNPSDNMQAIMRVHRSGQAKPVRVYYVTAFGTMDDRVQTILKQKTEMVMEVIDKKYGYPGKGVHG